MTTSFSPLMWISGELLAVAIFVAGSDVRVFEPPTPIVVSEGTVLSVELATITIRVVSNDETQSFSVAQDARVTLDGRRASLHQLFTGDHAKVTASPKQTRLVASEIEARSPL